MKSLREKFIEKTYEAAQTGEVNLSEIADFFLQEFTAILDGLKGQEITYSKDFHDVIWAKDPLADGFNTAVKAFNEKIRIAKERLE